MTKLEAIRKIITDNKRSLQGISNPGVRPDRTLYEALLDIVDGEVFSIDSLSDVTISSAPTEGQVLYYDSSLNAWVPKNKAALDEIQIDVTHVTDSAEGKIHWNIDDGTLQIGLLGGNLNLDVGQENLVRINNTNAYDLSVGQAVYVTGAQGQRVTVELANASGEGSSSRTLGIVAEPIPSGSEGFIATFGLVRNVNTKDFPEGRALYLDSTDGALTIDKPLTPDHLVIVGFCVRQQQSSGSIFVTVSNGYELEEIHDVLISSDIASGETIIYNGSYWENSVPQVSSSGTTGGTGSAGSGSQYVELTIEGVTYKVLHDGVIP